MVAVVVANLVSGPFRIITSSDDTWDVYGAENDDAMTNMKTYDVIKYFMDIGINFQKYLKPCVALIKYLFLLCPNVAGNIWKDDNVRMYEWAESLPDECANEIFRAVDNFNDATTSSTFDVYPFEIYAWVSSGDYNIFVTQDMYASRPIVRLGFHRALQSAFWKKCNQYIENGCSSIYDMQLFDMLMHFMPICDDTDFLEACLMLIGQYQFEPESDFARLLESYAPENQYHRLVKLQPQSSQMHKPIKKRAYYKRLRPESVSTPEPESSSSSSSSSSDEDDVSEYESDEDDVNAVAASSRIVPDGPKSGKSSSWIAVDYHERSNKHWFIDTKSMRNSGLTTFNPEIADEFFRYINMMKERAVDDPNIKYTENYIWVLKPIYHNLSSKKSGLFSRLANLLKKINNGDIPSYGDSLFILPFVYFKPGGKGQQWHYPLYIWFNQTTNTFSPHVFGLLQQKAQKKDYFEIKL